jgi:UMF1 family MFS transporter
MADPASAAAARIPPLNCGRRATMSWAFYDWANSAFAAVVMAVFFPLFFKDYASVGADAALTIRRLGDANALGSLLIVLLAPVLGAIADRGEAKKRFLVFFAFIGMVTTAGLFFVEKGAWEIAAALYILGVIGFSGSNIFYDSLLMSVADERKVDFVSGLGYALGYLGGGLLLAASIWMVRWPDAFGLEDAHEAMKVAFVAVGAWWAVFTVPLLLFVREPTTGVRQGVAAVAAGFRQLAATFREVRRLRVVMVFLLAYWLYIDGVDTIVRMAAVYGRTLGFGMDDIALAFLITQFIGFPAAIAYSKMGEKIGLKPAIFIGLGVYVGVCVWGYVMRSVWEFYAIAVAVGLVQGGVQALSRSFYTRIIPADKAGEFFGFYNMLGKFAAVLGPLMMGWVSVATGNPRYSILTVIVLFVAGAVFLARVDEAEGRRMASALERDDV